MPVKRILDFKTKHERELLAFRKYIRDLDKSLRSAKSERDVNRILSGAGDDVRRQCLDLDRRLKENKISTVLATLNSLVDFKVPTIAGVGAAFAALIGQGNPVVVGLTVLTVSAAIKVVSKIYEGEFQKRTLFGQLPAAYVFRVKRQFAQ